MNFTKGLRFGRLIWTLFVTWYFINFSRNFFNSLTPEGAQIPSTFFLIIVLWMAVEYYFSSPFLQSGIIALPSFERIIFSIFFYGNIIYCIADYSSHWTQLNFLYPYLNIIGIIIFTIGVLLRYLTLFELLRFPSSKLPKSGFFNICRHPRYLATIIQMMSIPFVFTSYLGLIIALSLGLLIIYKEIQTEEKGLIKEFKEEYLQYQNNVPFIIPKFSRLSLSKASREPKSKAKRHK